MLTTGYVEQRIPPPPPSPSLPVISTDQSTLAMRLRRYMLTKQQMTLEEAAGLALKVLKQVMEEKLDENNVQLARVSCPPTA